MQKSAHSPLALPTEAIPAKRIFFDGFHELRVLAALSVLVHHVELFKARINLPNLTETWLGPMVRYLGKNGVFLFFVLSGFLITYLLLEEKRRFQGRISFGSFYLRRVLRIWPLYFLVVAIGFFLMPWLAHTFPQFSSRVPAYYNVALHTHTTPPDILIMYLFFFSNLVEVLGIRVAGASQSWSVSVEEQFYLFWPWLVAGFKKLLPLVFVAVALLCLYIIFKHDEIVWLFKKLPYPVNLLGEYKPYFQYMAYGGILSWAVFTDRKWLTAWVGQRWVLPVVLVSLGVLLFLGEYKAWNTFFFGLLITHLAVSPGAFSGLGRLRPLMKQGGEISYGLYMLHPLVLFLVMASLRYFFPGIESSTWLFNLLFYGLGVCGSWALAWASYNYFEKPFLKIKHRFERVPSQGKVHGVA